MKGVVYMKLYEVFEDYCEGNNISYGLFSTYEKANELIKMFEGYDGFGICEESLHIREVEIIPDIIEDWVLKLLDSCKQRKKRYEEKYGAD